MHPELFNIFMTRISGLLTTRGTDWLNRPELQVTSPLVYLMGMTFVLTVMLGLMEPASSAGLNLLSRAVFWTLHLFPATLGAWMISGWLFNIRASRRVSPWLLLVIAGAVTGLLLAPISVTLELLFGVFDANDPQSKPMSFTVKDWISELKDELRAVPLTTACVWPAMNAFVVWRMRDDALNNRPAEIRSLDLAFVPQAPAAVIDVPPKLTPEQRGPIIAPQKKSDVETSGFLSRLPARLGQDIVFVEAQEHYLRVVTSRGEHLLLQGLTHAIAELEARGVDGIQIHRSVWVAWKHVENVDARTGTMSVFLSTGVCLKIGRRRAKAVLAAWHQRFT